MSFSKCVNKAIEAGKLTNDEAAELIGSTDSVAESIAGARGISLEEARIEAEQIILTDRKKRTLKQKEQAALQTVINSRNEKLVLAYEYVHWLTGTKTKDPNRGLLTLMVKDAANLGSKTNVDNRTEAAYRTLTAFWADGMNTLRPRMLGLSQNREGLDKFVKALFGDNVDDPEIMAAAAGWRVAADEARRQFNRAGGDIGELDSWHMPQHHDPVAVGKKTKEEWAQTIKPLLDESKMVDEAGVPYKAEQLDEMLAYTYDQITTDGLAHLVPGSQRGSGKLASRHSDQRFLHFKDADSWLKYQKDFGGGLDMFTMLDSHLRGMSKDIAMLEAFGPNPKAAYAYLRDVAKKAGAKESVKQLSLTDAVFRVVSGEADAVQSTALANVMGSIRNVNVASKLGGAFLSSISDLGFINTASRYRGMSTFNVLRGGIAQLGNAERQTVAARMGVGVEGWTNEALAANRFTEVTAKNWTSKTADVVMRLSFLTPTTAANRKFFGLEMNGVLVSNFSKSLDQTDIKFKKLLSDYGVTADDWNVIRQTKLTDIDGATYMAPTDLITRTDITRDKAVDLTRKIQEMIATETDYAVPMPDAYVRAVMTGGLKSGTVMGELTRALTMFKSFPVTVLTANLMRGLYQDGIVNKAAYLSNMIIATTVLGIIAAQAKDIAKGKEPRPISPELIAAGFMQGGGLGIFGDFMFQEANRFGQPLSTTLAGPVAGMMSDFHRLTVGNLQEAALMEDTNFPAELKRFMMGYTPGVNLWYTRLAVDRLISDKVEMMVNPKARQKFERMRKKEIKENERDYWWRPGQ